MATTIREKTERWRWLEERRRFICSTDITRILGLTPDSWGGPLSVWNDKTLPIEPDAANELFYWGHKLEPLIAERYAEEFDVEVIKFDEDYVTPFPHTEIAHVAATPDFLVGDMADRSTVTIVETKTVSAWMSDGWGSSGSNAVDNVPPHYVAQVLWQLGCCEVPRGVIAALIGGNDWRYYPIDADPEWFEMAATTARDWYIEHVHGDRPPPPDQRSEIIVGAPDESGLILIADDDLDEIIDARQELKAAEKASKAELGRLDAIICHYMGNQFDQINRRDGSVAATWRVGKGGTRRLVVR